MRLCFCLKACARPCLPYRTVPTLQLPFAVVVEPALEDADLDDEAVTAAGTSNDPFEVRSTEYINARRTANVCTANSLVVLSLVADDVHHTHLWFACHVPSHLLLPMLP